MPDETLITSAVGWFGKLPAKGDFIGHRIPCEFMSAWDKWLCAGMVEAKKDLGEKWSEYFLTFPVWFFLRRGSESTHEESNVQALYAGVLMPSTDSVGRLFPLTAWFEIPTPLFVAIDASVIESRLNAIAALMLEVLETDDLGSFEQGLAGMPPLGNTAMKHTSVTAAHGRRMLKQANPTLAAYASDLGKRSLLNWLENHAAFWNARDDSDLPMLLLPEPLSARDFLYLVDPEQQVME